MPTSPTHWCLTPVVGMWLCACVSKGQSGGKGVCGPCPSFLEGGDADSGCHPRLARTSYTHGPTFGLVSATFATRFTSGPEQKPWV
jgi:hypothetical protein